MFKNETFLGDFQTVWVVLFFLKLNQFENETATHVEGYVMCKMKSHEREKERKKMET